MKRLLLTIALFLIASQSWARSGGSTAAVVEKAGYDTNLVFEIHDTGYLRSTVTNFGYFGSINNRLRDSAGEVVPVLESPPNSGVEYLYEAGLWIGGVVDGDTLVSTGSLEFGQGAQHELYANSRLPGQYSDWDGDEEWTYLYSDRLTDPETVRDDLYDGPHRPMPVIVRQRTYTFDAPGINNAVFIDLTITNHGDWPIDDAWIGWMMDPDIGDRNLFATAIDDITGHSQSRVATADGEVDVSFAWAMDNDGDPDPSGQFGGMSPTRVLGSMYLGGTPYAVTESYNWWNASTNRRFDWGPGRAPADTNRFGGYGRAFGDRERYRLMSNGELDYAQVFAAIDRSSEGWISPPVDAGRCDSILCDSLICDPAVCYATARAIANGSDARFLHTVGPFTIPARKSVTLHWVWCVAENPEARPLHFSRTFDANTPEEYLDGLGLGSTEIQMARLKLAWASRFANVPVGPPNDFHVMYWNSSSCELRWHPRSTRRLRGYQITRSRAPRSNEPRDVYHLPRIGVFRDTGLTELQEYSYTISCIGSDYQSGGIIGPASPRLAFLPDRPLRPRAPALTNLSDRIHVTLRGRPKSYPAYRVERRGADGAWAVIGSMSNLQVYIDSDIVPATPYWYRLTAISAAGTASEPGDSAVAAAFSFDGPSKILDFTPRGPTSLTDKDSVAAVWMRLANNAIYLDASESVITLADFDSTAGVFVVAEGRAPLPDYVHEFLDLYSNASGPTIISGRDLFNEALSSEVTVTLASSSIGYVAGIRRVFYPSPLLANPTRMNAEFTAAMPSTLHMPFLAADSTRTAWGLSPLLPHPGNAIPIVGYFAFNVLPAEVLYTYVSNESASPSAGRPVAVISRDETRRLAILGFPLSYIREDQAAECVAALLDVLGTVDESPTEIGRLIDYLYRDGMIDSREGDSNEDGVIDVRDIVHIVGTEIRRR